MGNTSPINNGNSINTYEICASVHPVIIIRQEALAEFFSDEPQFIIVKKKVTDEGIPFEQVLRIRMWIPNEGIVSHQIYSNYRQWKNDNQLGPIVIRKVKWNRTNEILHNLDKPRRQELLVAWPDLTIENIYYDSIPLEIFHQLERFDAITSNGVVFENESGKTMPWSNIELMRLFDWGSVQATWNNEKSNKVIENLCKEIMTALDKFVQNSKEKVFEMKLDYSIPPDIFKQIVTGEL